MLDSDSHLVAVADAEQLDAEELESRLALVAERLQEGVVRSLDDHAWPKCPEHEHPLVADHVGGHAVWRCPAAGGTTWLVGTLPRVRE